MKRLLLPFSVLGLVGCFLPLLAGLSWFELRHFDQGWTVWLVVVAFAIPTVIATIANDRDFGAAVVVAGCYGYLLLKFNTGVFDLLFHTSIGGIMMGVAVVGGAFASALALLIASNRKR